MKKLLLIAPLCLAAAACITPDISDERVQAFVTASIAAEVAASIRCPRSDTERAVFLAGRAAFDLSFAPRLLPMQVEAIGSARRATDIACDFTPAEAAAAALAVDAQEGR